MQEFIYDPWPWYISGPLLTLVVFILLYSGKNFGLSGNFRTMCAIAGGSKFSNFFQFDWRAQKWNLVLLFGVMLGGFISANYLSNGEDLLLNPSTIVALESMGFHAPNGAYLPLEIFGTEALFSSWSGLILLFGGFLVGFGARYAGGCTSGHAISGLSELQIPSLIAVAGFFIGGLLMSHLFLPIIF